MKKKTKKILLIVLIAVCALVLSFGIAITVDCSTGGIGGTVVTNVQEGYGQDEWRHYDVNVEIYDRYNEKLYTNEDGDYLTGIYFTYTKNGYVRVEYNNYFNIADDFEAFFVLSNMKEGDEEKHYITPVETTHWLYGDSISVSCKDLCPGFDYTDEDFEIVFSYHIVEVWIRTVD